MANRYPIGLQVTINKKITLASGKIIAPGTKGTIIDHGKPLGPYCVEFDKNHNQPVHDIPNMCQDDLTPDYKSLSELLRQYAIEKYPRGPCFPKKSEGEMEEAKEYNLLRYSVDVILEAKRLSAENKKLRKTLQEVKNALK